MLYHKQFFRKKISNLTYLDFANFCTVRNAPVKTRKLSNNHSSIFYSNKYDYLKYHEKNQGYIMSGYENKCSISQNLYSPQQCTVRNAWVNRKFLVNIPINFNGKIVLYLSFI